MKIDNIEALSLEIVNFACAFGFRDRGAIICSENAAFWALREVPRFKRYRLPNYCSMFATAVAKLQNDEVFNHHPHTLVMAAD